MHLRMLAVGTVALALFAACTSTEPLDESSGETTSTSVAPTSTTQTTASSSSTSTASSITTLVETTTTVPPPPTVDVHAFDYRYEGLPEAVPVGTRLALFNNSSAEFHEMVVYKLDPSELRSVEELSQLTLDDLTAFGVGSIQSVVFSMPDSEQYTYADGPPILAEQGRYLIFCAINVGTDPIDARNETARGPTAAIDGVPRHYQVGMMTEINATG